MSERTASSPVFDRWMGQASENIDRWGLQDEETLLLAIQEELGELTRAHLEAKHEDGDPHRVDEEIDDLGALLLQLHERRNVRKGDTGTSCVSREYQVIVSYYDYEDVERRDEQIVVTARSKDEAKRLAREQTDKDVQFVVDVAETSPNGGQADE